MKVTDGQNISLLDALTRCGFKSTGDGFELTNEDGQKFTLVNLIGEVKALPVLENDENIQAGNSANGEQDLKAPEKKKQESNDDNIQLAPQEIKEHSIDKENSKQTKALEQNGFHVISEDGYQSSNTGVNKNQKKKLL